MSLQSGQDSQDCGGNKIAEQSVTGDGGGAQMRLGVPKNDAASGLETASGLESGLTGTRKGQGKGMSKVQKLGNSQSNGGGQQKRVAGYRGGDLQQDEVGVQCKICTEEFTSSKDKLMQCERCEDWCCKNCLCMPDGVYRYLTARKDIHWFCVDCEKNALRAVKQDHQIEERCEIYLQKFTEKFTEKIIFLEVGLASKVNVSDLDKALTFTAADIGEMVTKQLAEVRKEVTGNCNATQLLKLRTEMLQISNDLQNSVTDLGKRLDEKLLVEKIPGIDCHYVQECVEGAVQHKLQECVEGVVQHKLQEDEDEKEEINKRRTSVMVHGLTEPYEEDAEVRRTRDSDSMVDILHELKCDDVSVNKIFRLGTYQGDQGTKPRPLIMVLASEEQKDKLLKQAKNLRNKRDKGLDKVFIHQDLTPHQRMRRQKLVQEMKIQ